AAEALTSSARFSPFEIETTTPGSNVRPDETVPPTTHPLGACACGSAGYSAATSRHAAGVTTRESVVGNENVTILSSVAEGRRPRVRQNNDTRGQNDDTR